MIGVFLFAWVVFPTLMLLLCAGAGLAVRRVAGPTSVPPVLVLPLGLAVLVVIAGMFCYAAPLAPLASPALVLVGVIGLALGRDSIGRTIKWRGRGVDLWAVAAGLGAFAMVAAPVVLSGKPGFTGYGRIVDISYELDLAVHLAHSGRHIPADGFSAFQIVMKKYLGAGYPGGGPWTLGALSNLTPVDLSWLYQPFLAFVAAMSGLSLYSLLRPLVQNRALRALGAFIASQPNVLYAYTLAGGIKELCTSCFLLLVAALFGPVMHRVRPGRATLAIPFAVAAAIASFSLTSLPWLGVLCAGVGVTVLALQRDRVATLLGSLQIAAVTFVLSLPTFFVAFKLLPYVTGTGPVDIGNLAAPVPGISAAGVWIGGDARFPQYAHQLPSEVLAVVVLVLALCGLVFAVRRRAWSLAWLGVAGAVALYYVAHRYGPWIQFKADSITSPIALLLAFGGAGALLQGVSGRCPPPDAPSGTRRLLAGTGPLGRIGVLLGVLAIAGGVLVGNALLYHDVTLSPYARLHDLQQIGERFAAQGPTLTPDFDEFAEYYLRDGRQDSMVNGPAVGLRPGVDRAAEPGGVFAYDLNEFSLSWIESFRTIVMRRNPLASRPPANYRLVEISDYYEVWQRAQPARTIFAHVPFKLPANRDPGACAEAKRLARKAGPSARLAYTSAPTGYVQVDGSNMALRGAFSSAGGTIVASGAGRATRDQLIPASGTYRFFLNGSFGRPVNVSIDGYHVGTGAYQVSYPGQWILIGSRRLTRGVHKVDITRGGISLHPGNGDGIDLFNRTIGALVIIPEHPAVPPIYYRPVSALPALCRSSEPLRWLEFVRPA